MERMNISLLLLAQIILGVWLQTAQAACRGKTIDFDYGNRDKFKMAVKPNPGGKIKATSALKGAPSPGKITLTNKRQKVTIATKSGPFNVESMEFEFKGATSAIVKFLSNRKAKKQIKQKGKGSSTKVSVRNTISGIDTIVISFKFSKTSKSVSLSKVFLKSCFQQRTPLSDSPVQQPGANGRRFLEDCSHIFDKGNRKSGIYTTVERELYCDMETEGGGWTVIQRRIDGRNTFTGVWKQYKEGFGLLELEFWFGNEDLAAITSSRDMPFVLRIELESFSGEKRYAEYENFRVAPESDNYRLHLGAYSGDVGDQFGGFSEHSGLMFSTTDRDNDLWEGNCAQNLGGRGWWYGSCGFVMLNGRHYRNEFARRDGIYWTAWKGELSLKSVEMKIRPMATFGPF